MSSYTHLEQLVYLHVYVLLMDDEEVKGQCFSDWIIHLGCNQMMMDRLPFLEYQMLKQHAMINLFCLYTILVLFTYVVCPYFHAMMMLVLNLKKRIHPK